MNTSSMVDAFTSKGQQVINSLQCFYHYIEGLDHLQDIVQEGHNLRMDNNELLLDNEKFVFPKGLRHQRNLGEHLYFITLECVAELLNISCPESLEKLMKDYNPIRFEEDPHKYYRLPDILNCFNNILKPFIQK